MVSERWVDADSYEAGFADAGYPGSYEAHLRRRVKELERELGMAKKLLGDVLDGGYGAEYGWEDAHDWLKKHSPEYAAQYE